MTGCGNLASMYKVLLWVRSNNFTDSYRTASINYYLLYNWVVVYKLQIFGPLIHFQFCVHGSWVLKSIVVVKFKQVAFTLVCEQIFIIICQIWCIKVSYLIFWTALWYCYFGKLFLVFIKKDILYYSLV